MKIELLLAVKQTGNIFELSTCTKSISYTTNRTGSPGKLSFTVLKSGQLSFTEGDQVRLTVDGTLVFYGWVFSKSKNRWGEIDVVCYDRLRYLKANASYAFYTQTAGNILRTIAADFQLATSTVDNTWYAIPSLVQQNKSCMDIINEAVQQTLLNTGKLFVLFDDGNGLSLRESRSMIAPIGDVVVGDGSLLTSYTYKTDIDTQTYNSVRIAKADEESGVWKAVEAMDSETIGQWGLLRLYKTVDGDVNEAQMLSEAKTTLQAYNRRNRTLSASSLGVVGVRAGMLLRMHVQGLGDMDLNQYVLLEKVTHKWENNVHTMDFETVTIGDNNGTA